MRAYFHIHRIQHFVNGRGALSFVVRAAALLSMSFAAAFGFLAAITNPHLRYNPHAFAIGTAALRLGAGRQTKDDMIDHAVGVRCLKKRGDAVASGEAIAEVHARDDRSADEAVDRVLAAYTFDTEAPPRRPIVLETLG